MPQPELCLQCHQMRRAQLQRSSHMPYREGKVTCTSCHNPHGSPNPSQLLQSSINENCISCHTERRGPFLWEHPPVMENCANCHEPHGSSKNDSGVIVGECFEFKNTANQLAFMWDPAVGASTFTPLLYAGGINSLGTIVGFGTHNQAAVWSVAIGQTTDLGTLGDFSIGISINTQGHVSGYSALVASGPVHAFFYDGKGMHDLGSFGKTDSSTPAGMNNDDLVVGSDLVPAGGGGHVKVVTAVERALGAHVVGNSVATIWSATTGLIDLNKLLVDPTVGTLAYATGIDAEGRIVGAVIMPDQSTHGFMLTGRK